MINNPIFIISLHRSGSTLLKNILDSNSKVSICPDELHLVEPIFFSVEKSIKSNKNKSKRELIDIIFRNHLNGSGWQDYNKLTLLKSKIMESIESEFDIEEFAKALLDKFRELENRQIVGIKYPLHHSKVKYLQKWFPDAKIIFLTRDIRAIIASKINDEATRQRKSKSGIFGIIVNYITILYFIFDFIWFSRSLCKNKNDILFTKYEIIGKNPQKEVKRICEFSEIPYEKEMLNACGKPSSYNEKLHYGFDISRLNKWERMLNNFDKKIITFLSKRAMKRIGY